MCTAIPKGADALCPIQHQPAGETFSTSLLCIIDKWDVLTPLQSIECLADVIVTTSKGKKGTGNIIIIIIIRDHLYQIDFVVPVLITQTVIQTNLWVQINIYQQINKITNQHSAIKSLDYYQGMLDTTGCSNPLFFFYTSMAKGVKVCANIKLCRKHIPVSMAVN